MFNYRQNGPFQTPRAGPSTHRRVLGGGLRSIQEDREIYSAMKPSKTNANGRAQRRFGTNLTNKKTVSRINYHQYDLSKTQQIYKPSKQISFASRAAMTPQSTFNYNLRAANKEKAALEEPEYCPSGTSWKPAINRSLHRVLQRAFKAIGGYKLFIPSGPTEEMDHDIPERFEGVYCPQNGMALSFLNDTDSEDTEEDLFECRLKGNCDIPLIEERAEEVMLECPIFL